MRKTRAIPLILIIVLTLAGLLLTPTLADSPPLESSYGPSRIADIGYYDSGWQSVAPAACQTFQHNLGGEPNDYAVEVLFMDDDPGGLGIHRRGYGGLDLSGSKQGAHWQRLTTNRIQVCRGPNAPFVDRVRVRVWIPEPSAVMWDSGWRNINPGQQRTFNHGLNVTATDLVVSLWFKDTSAGPGNIGIHQLHYGGIAINATAEFRGAHWHYLTNNTVKVTRHPDDIAVDQVRVLVVEADPPDYDSLAALGGWTNLAQGTPFTFKHNLNWPRHQLLVRVECKSPTWEIHQLLAGGSRDWTVGLQGANVQRLQENSVQVLRWSNDQVCPQARVRIWSRAAQVYVPLVVLDDV